jgi:hypothetical protein
MMWRAIPVVGKLLSGVLDLVDQAVEDKDKAAAMKADLAKVFEKGDLARFTATVEAQSKVLLAEIQGQSWMQRNWRPILMLVIVAIIANNFLIYPYLSLFTSKSLVLQLPNELYNLMTVGVGGYIVGRSAEKGLRIFKGQEDT